MGRNRVFIQFQGQLTNSLLNITAQFPSPPFDKVLFLVGVYPIVKYPITLSQLQLTVKILSRVLGTRLSKYKIVSGTV